MNRSKTKCMTNGPKFPVRVGDVEIEYVDEFVYLGQLVSFSERMNKELDVRIKIGWRKFCFQRYYEGKWFKEIKRSSHKKMRATSNTVRKPDLGSHKANE